MSGKLARSISGNEIFLLRHGETEWNAEGRFQGILDSPLTEWGKEQARACGRKLASVVTGADAMLASPLGRVRETCSILRSFAEYPDVTWDDALKEVTLGKWDGLTHVDIDAMWPSALAGSSQFDWYFRSPDGEGFETALARVSDWLGRIEGVVVAVSHGLLGRIIRGAYLGLSRAEMLALPVPQDTIWHLCDRRIAGIQT